MVNTPKNIAPNKLGESATSRQKALFVGLAALVFVVGVGLGLAPWQDKTLPTIVEGPLGLDTNTDDSIGKPVPIGLAFKTPLSHAADQDGQSTLPKGLPNVEEGDHSIGLATPTKEIEATAIPVQSAIPKETTADAANAVAAFIPPKPIPVLTGGRPRIAFVIDDMGLAQHRSARTANLPGPLTLAYLPYAEDLGRQTALATKNGHELILHLPMEPFNRDVDPGPNALLTGVDEVTLQDLLSWNLSRFDGFVGVNNHMGSRFTSELEGMGMVMTELKRRGLFFLDSMTSAKSVALQSARAAGVAATGRDVFLDHVDDPTAIRKALRQTLRVARQNGTAIAIGHPRPATIAALQEWLSSDEAREYDLVPLSDIVRLRLKGDPRLAFLGPKDEPRDP